MRGSCSAGTRGPVCPLRQPGSRQWRVSHVSPPLRARSGMRRRDECAQCTVRRGGCPVESNGLRGKETALLTLSLSFAPPVLISFFLYLITLYLRPQSPSPSSLTDKNTLLNRRENGGAGYARRRGGLRHRNWSDDDDGEAPLSEAEKEAERQKIRFTSRPVPDGVKGCLKRTPSPFPTSETDDSDYMSEGGTVSRRRRVRVVEPGMEKASLEEMRAASGKGRGIGGFRSTRSIYSRGQGGDEKELTATASSSQLVVQKLNEASTVLVRKDHGSDSETEGEAEDEDEDDDGLVSPIDTPTPIGTSTSSLSLAAQSRRRSPRLSLPSTGPRTSSLSPSPSSRLRTASSSPSPLSRVAGSATAPPARTGSPVARVRKVSIARAASPVGGGGGAGSGGEGAGGRPRWVKQPKKTPAPGRVVDVEVEGEEEDDDFEDCTSSAEPSPKVVTKALPELSDEEDDDAETTPPPGSASKALDTTDDPTPPRRGPLPSRADSPTPNGSTRKPTTSSAPPPPPPVVVIAPETPPSPPPAPVVVPSFAVQKRRSSLRSGSAEPMVGRGAGVTA